MPELAHDDSPAGAEAFVRHYIDVLNYAALTGDTSELKDLSGESCNGCHSYVELFSTMYKAGGHMTGGEWSITSSRPLKEDPHSFLVSISAAPGTSVPTANADEESHDSYDDELVFAVEHSQDVWQVVSLDRAVER